ncbi:Lysophospholipase L1 [Cognatiyoonia koreensis]|uniref:Lysophospholipase L1 n=1 Tax=Cognatiyoonia koreensis TaxID=364200 RepID=A0A1I0P9X4_9RHOB|nr:SGNH/GDSL hydrolase family protein [Cognatiyoonia koreensis]SEW11058.1 Lysophospholipase L1 [Cognatiyoonia koreensis]
MFMDFGRIILFPVILTQGLWVAARAQCMPEPEGPRTGTLGHGPELRVLIVGDSSAVGVGVRHQDEALAGQTVRRLAQDFTVHWRVIAKTGATAGDTVKRLQSTTATPYDVAITALGVNDAKNGVSASAWQKNYTEVLRLLSTRFEVKHITACGLPPVHDFPLLPHPLKGILSRRTQLFDRLLQNIVHHHLHAQFLPLPKSLDPAHMAEDGFHAGPLIYDEWGNHTAASINQHFAH